MIDAIFRHPTICKYLVIERAKNEKVVTFDMRMLQCLLYITSYLANEAWNDMQTITVVIRTGSSSNHVLHCGHVFLDLVNVAFLYPKYLTATTYRTYRPCHSIILYKRIPPMPMQRSLYACYAGGIT